MGNSKGLKICKVWDHEYPWDVRVEKVSRALTDAGHHVHLTARNRGRLRILEDLPEATVHRLSPTPWLGRRLEAAGMFPAFFNPRWFNLIRRTAVDTAADVLLVRDLPLTPTAIWVGRRLGLPIIHDMAENYGAMIRDLWHTGTTRWGDSLIRNPALVDQVERWCLKRLDHVIVVVEESRERLIDLGVPSDKITVASNTPPLARLSNVAPTKQRREALHVVYLGLMERARGVSLAIQAVAICEAQGVSVRLTLIGDGRNLVDFQKEAEAARLRPDQIRFLGFLPNDQALEIVAQADVGIIPHHVNESWNSTIPNKLFDYMAAGVVVVASNAHPVERVVRESACGRIFKDRDPQHLAAVLAELQGMEDRSAFSHAGQRAIRTRYNWENDSARLVRAVERTVSSSASRTPT